MQSAHRSTLAARAVPRATVFRALPTPAATAATVAAVVALLLAFLLVWRAAGDGVTFASFLSYTVAVLLMGAAVILAGWAVALARLRYEVTYGTLTIVWGLTRQVVPLLEIERVVRGRALGLPVVEGLALPRLPAAVGRSRVQRLGEVLLYSTHRAPSDLLYVVTAHEVYGISPADAAGLIQALQAAAAFVDEEAIIRQEVLRSGMAAWPIWADGAARVVLTAGALIALLACAVVFARYTGTTDPTTLPFPDGERVGPRRELLGIPLVAVALVALNGAAAAVLHRTMRPVAWVLLLGTIFVEALLVVAALAAT